jgi:hypothetical protein
MTVDVDDRRTIETGRSWRDLPAGPPRTLRVVPQPEPAAAATEPTRRRGRGVATVLLAALLAGLAVGWWSPWSTADGDVGAAPTTVAPEGIEGLPDTIVPDVPEDLFTQPQPEEFDPFGFFEELPPFDGFPGAQDELGLVRLGPLPDGYREIGSLVTRTDDDVRHQIRLLGPEGLATVRAERDPAATLPDEGAVVDVGGVEGRLVEGSTNTVTWRLGDVVVTAHAPAEVSVETLLSIAAAVEVVE